MRARSLAGTSTIPSRPLYQQGDITDKLDGIAQASVGVQKNRLAAKRCVAPPGLRTSTAMFPIRWALAVFHALKAARQIPQSQETNTAGTERIGMIRLKRE